MFTDSNHMNRKSRIDQNILPIFTLIKYCRFHFLVKFVLQWKRFSLNKESCWNYGRYKTWKCIYRPVWEIIDSTSSMRIHIFMNELQYKQGKFQTNSAIHHINSSRECHVHRQVSSFQKSTYYLGSKYSTVYHAHWLEWKHSI